MSIFDFLSKPSATAPAGTTPTPGQPGQPPAAAPAATPTPPVTPLDQFTLLMQNASKVEPNQAPQFQLDPKVLGEVSNKLDFTASLPQDVKEGLAKGDMNSLLAAFNHVGRQAYETSLTHATTLTDAHLGIRSQHDSKLIGDGVRQQLTTQNLASNPAFQNPLVQAEATRIAQQIAKANPNATPAEVADGVKQYFKTINDAFNPAAPAQQPQKAGEVEDWGKLLGFGQ